MTRYAIDVGFSFGGMAFQPSGIIVASVGLQQAMGRLPATTHKNG